MRREVARAAVTAAWIGLAVLAIPLAVAVYLLVVGNETGELERLALRAAVRTDPRELGTEPVRLPAVEAGGELGVYDRDGRLRAGTGPPVADQVVSAARRGRVAEDVGSMLVVAVPVASSERVDAVVRAASPVSVVWRRTAAGWAGLGVAVGASLAAALLVARRRAHRLAEPMEALASASRAVGEGDFSARAPLCGIEEIDRVASTQNLTAQRLGEMLAREREFAANASHQLRTPLAGLHLGLERALTEPDADLRSALGEALETAERLQGTVRDVLALHRRSRSGGERTGARAEPVAALLEAAERRWRSRFEKAGRVLASTGEQLPEARTGSADRVNEILDILLDNALRHGGGRTEIGLRRTGRAIAIDVRDEGAGVTPDLGDIFRRGTGRDHGIGLSLAREFAASMGARLLLTARRPPVFTLVLPMPTEDNVT